MPYLEEVFLEDEAIIEKLSETNFSIFFHEIIIFYVLITA